MCICDYLFLVKTCYYDIIIINALADKPKNKESESESMNLNSHILRGKMYLSRA